MLLRSSRGRLSGAMVVVCAILISGGCTTRGEFRSAMLHGLVYDENQNPLSLVTLSANQGPSIQTDNAGRFSIPDVPLGSVEVTAQCPGFIPFAGEIQFSTRTQVLCLQLESIVSALDSICDQAGTGETREARRRIDALVDLLPDDPGVRYLAGLLALRDADVAAAQQHIAALPDEVADYDAVARLANDVRTAAGVLP